MVVLACVVATPARAQEADTVTVRNCAASMAAPAADPRVVRAQGQIPSRWKLALETDGRATLFIVMVSCDLTVNGRSRPVTYAELGARLDHSALPTPERSRATSGFAGIPVDIYILGYYANDRELVRWYRAGTALGSRVEYVPGLALTRSGTGLREFSYKAPRPASSPFMFTAAITEPFFPVSPAIANFWHETAKGSVMIETNAAALRVGFFESSDLEAAPGSPLDRMLGGAVQHSICPVDKAADPLLGLAAHDFKAGCLATLDPGVEVWRKNLPRAVRPTRSPAPPPPSHSDIRRQCARYARQSINADVCAAGVEAGRAASAKYRDVNRAIADGYVQFTNCESSPMGAMGEHWARVDRMVDPALDVRAPEILLYLNTPQGRELLGFEYEQTATFGGLPVWGSTHPNAPVSARPSLLGGKAFDGPMAGHSPIQPWHYDLHVYTWVKNPAGLFEMWNPAVKC
jgi:hypothetical protein